MEPVQWACWWACRNILELFGYCLIMRLTYFKETSSSGAKVEGSLGFSVVEVGLSFPHFLSYPWWEPSHLPEMPAWLLSISAANFRGAVPFSLGVSKVSSPESGMCAGLWLASAG